MRSCRPSCSSGFGSAMRNGLLMVYVVLALLFASLLQPITILFSLPLSIAGAIMALLITSSPLTLPVVIGLLMLLGIVTKNAIMLVDFAVDAMHRGLDARPPSSRRVRNAPARSS